MGEDDFNKRELYYQIDGGEFKLLPIKPLTISEIEMEQSKLDVNGWVKYADVGAEAVINNVDPLFRIIESIHKHFEEQDNLYCICEMAKRYLYLLKEQDMSKEKLCADWVKEESETLCDTYYCSNCGTRALVNTVAKCPVCGAKMQKEIKNEVTIDSDEKGDNDGNSTND